MADRPLSRDAKLRWDEFLADPSAFWDVRHCKKSQRSPDFKHKQTGKALWLDAWFNPPFLKHKLHDLGFVDSPGKFHDQSSILSLINSYRKDKNLVKVKRIHDELCGQSLLAGNICIATALIMAYAKCGSLDEAQKVFDQLPTHDIVSWNALISGYAQQGLGSEALKCFRQMQDAGVCPDGASYVCILKTCGIVGSIKLGEGIDAVVRQQGLLKKDLFIGTALVDMYCKCHALEKAQKLFEELPMRNVVSWNVLINGYMRQGLGDQALQCFKKMQDAAVSPDAVTYVCVLKACSIIGCLELGQGIDIEIRKKGLLEKDVVLGTAVIDMYSKCGSLEKAREVFELLPVQNVITWNALIAGYIQHSQGEEALKCYKQMQDGGIYPDAVTYACILKACGIVGCLEIGEDIHKTVTRQGLLQTDAVLGNVLVDMYAKCGLPHKAQEVFEQLPVQNVVSWSALIDGYTQHGLGNEALECFKQMQDAGICPNAVTYVSILKACGIVGAIGIGEAIHEKIRKDCLLQKDLILGTALVDMYFKCSALDRAQEVFDQLPTRDVVAWNALISGYAQQGLAARALKCFREMEDNGVCPDTESYISILKACSSMESLEIGESIDVKVREKGLLQNDIRIGTALVEMYSCCAAFERAKSVFEQLPAHNVVIWNALITGYTQHGLNDEALKCFKNMQAVGFSPDAVSYVCILKACGNAGSLEIGEDIYAEVRKQGLLQKNVVLGTALIDMYCKCGALKKAQDLFQQLPLQNIVTWNVLISGYARHGFNIEILNCFKKIQDMGIYPDAVTYIYILKACGTIGSLDIGEAIDTKVRKQGLLQRDEVIGNALVDMYSKCGVFKKAHEVFLQLPTRNIGSWNALIAGCSHLGEADLALDLYARMVAENVVPDLITFIVLLTACSHVGLLKEGEKVFDEMCYIYCLCPTVEHYTCMVDLFGRMGYFGRVASLLDRVSHSGHLPLFLTVLGACRKWRNVRLGRWAFEQYLKLDGQCASAFVCMENIYASVGMQTEADEMKWKLPEWR